MSDWLRSLMGIEIKIIINDQSSWRAKRYRATPEQIERNRREIAIQNERDQRAREKAYQRAESESPKK